MNEDLDRLMAEKVMGAELNERSQYWVFPPKPYGRTVHVQHWQPTRRIEQAMECLIKALQDGLIVEYAISGNRDNAGECEVWVLAPDETVGLKEYEGNSTLDQPAEAICQALKEVM